ncbi:hypothetical protein [Flexivirga meconopsidis]|uniref:hypothetical protein n=1 Tax=Flexivirga meconopsidis TaxID=2977121 RepID=UPI00223F5915|nr:hypothetical protein [Flexivirga meconopsidis]
MNPTTGPVPTRKVLWAGALACVASIIVTIATQSALRDDLAAAYTYTPDRTLDGAHSATLTYLFTIAGCGLVLFSSYALAGQWAQRSWLRWSAVAVLVTASALAVYNLTQPFPFAVKLVGLLPPAVGLFSVAMLFGRRDSARR